MNMKNSITKLLLTAGLVLSIACCKKEEEESHVYRPTYGIPTIIVTSDGYSEITSKDDNIPCTVKVFKDGVSTPLVDGEAIIHVRGNATAGYPKRPYKIRFKEKQSLCGMTENRDWVLLALYCDHSLIRETFLHKLAEKVDMPYQIHHKYVMLKINGQELGTYLLTDQVERAKDRVELDDDGFIIERDNNWNKEPLYVPTARGHYFTFKYPNADDGKIVSGDAEYTFIKKFLDNFEYAVYHSDFSTETGYRKYIDARSWAKWFLVQELAGNIDTNPYYALKNHNSKLEAGPVWDAEWSFGLAAIGTSGWAKPPTQPKIEDTYWGGATYYRHFFTDPYFVGLVKEEWGKLKPQIPAILKEMDELKQSIKSAQAHNFKIWPILDEYTSVGLVHFGNWSAECDYVYDFFDKHYKWFDTWIAAK